MNYLILFIQKFIIKKYLEKVFFKSFNILKDLNKEYKLLTFKEIDFTKNNKKISFYLINYNDCETDNFDYNYNYSISIDGYDFHSLKLYIKNNKINDKNFDYKNIKLVSKNNFGLDDNLMEFIEQDNKEFFEYCDDELSKKSIFKFNKILLKELKKMNNYLDIFDKSLYISKSNPLKKKKLDLKMS